MSSLSVVAFDSKPLLVRKHSYVKSTDFAVHYDPNADSLTVTKTEHIVHRSTSGSTSSTAPPDRPASLPRWPTIRELAFQDSPPHVSTDEGVYASVTSRHLSDVQSCQSAVTPVRQTSLSSSVVSSHVVALQDYLSAQNVLKVSALLLCLNGLLLQALLLSIQFFSQSSPASPMTSLTVCLTSLNDNSTTLQISEDLCRQDSSLSRDACLTCLFADQLVFRANISATSSPVGDYWISLHATKGSSAALQTSLPVSKTSEILFENTCQKNCSLVWTSIRTLPQNSSSAVELRLNRSVLRHNQPVLSWSLYTASLGGLAVTWTLLLLFILFVIHCARNLHQNYCLEETER